jgi:hypothetical protein
MGGTTSKFADTDWTKADGELEHTLDGRTVQPHYTTFSIQKQAYNQRDYDVIDEDLNLVYTTKSVLGTIASFDVYTMDDTPLLRVSADLARRHWMVFRYHVPVFDQQKPDVVASAKIAAEYRELGLTSNPPLLYRAACITVGWSRYLAVCARFGPPATSSATTLGNQKLDTNKSKIIHDEDATDDALFMAASKVTSQMINREAVVKDRGGSTKADGVVDSLAVSSGQKATVRVSTKEEVEDNMNDDDNKDTQQQPQKTEQKEQSTAPLDNPSDPMHLSASMPELSLSSSTDKASASPIPHSDSTHSLRIRRANSKKSLVFKWNKKQASIKRDPLQGVLSLDEPLLLCREIYNRIIGNHQTSIITKEKVLELFQQDHAEHATAETKDTDTNDPIHELLQANSQEENELLPGESMEAEWNPDWEETEGHAVYKVVTAGTVDESTIEQNADEGTQADTTNNKAATTTSNDNSSDSIDTTNGKLDLTNEGNHETNSNNNNESPRDKQPLVGYWAWENTLRVHKMRLHLAQRGDLAQHVVLAIIMNQVRCERHVALTAAV